MSVTTATTKASAALLHDLIERARAAGHHTIIGGACTEQAASLALQEALGFERVACFREVGHKFGRWLDVAYMQLLLWQMGDAEPSAAAAGQLPDPVTNGSRADPVGRAVAPPSK